MRHPRGFGEEGFVPLLVVEFEGNDHDFAAVLALEPLANHETHVRVHPNPVAVDADTEGHRGSLLFFGEGVAEFGEVDAVVAVGIERLDDLRNLGWVEPFTGELLDAASQFRPVQRPVAVGVDGIEQLLNVHALLTQQTLQLVKGFGDGPFFIGHETRTGPKDKTVAVQAEAYANAFIVCLHNPFAMNARRTSALCLTLLMVLSTSLGLLAVPVPLHALSDGEGEPSAVATTTGATFTGGATNLSTQVGMQIGSSIPLEHGYRMADGTFRATFNGAPFQTTTTYSVANGLVTGTGAGTLLDNNAIVLQTDVAGPPQAGNNSTTMLAPASMSGTHAYDSLELACGISSCGQITATADLTLYVNSLIVQSGASITADDLTGGNTGQGSSTTAASNGNTDGGGGGGHGGAGGDGGGGSGGAGGSTYGNGTQAGSQGGGVSSTIHSAVSGGQGGGVIRIYAGSIIVNGTVQANGGDGDAGSTVTQNSGPGGSGGGGGSGGSVYIQTNSLSVGFFGNIRANGGAGGDGANGVANGPSIGMYDGGDGGGGGGGGRVTIATQAGQYSNSGVVQANGGVGGTKGLKYGSGMDGVDGNTGSNGVVSTSTWNGYISLSNTTVNNGAFVTDPITTQTSDALPAYVVHDTLQPNMTNLSVFQRFTLTGNTSSFAEWTDWMEGNLSGETLPRHRHVQFMYVLNRTGAASPSVFGFDLRTTQHTTLTGYDITYDNIFDLFSSCPPPNCDNDLGLTNTVSTTGTGMNHTLTLNIPFNATFTDDLHVLVQWDSASSATQHPSLTGVQLGGSIVNSTSVPHAPFGHDLMLTMADLNAVQRTVQSTDASGIDWSALSVGLMFDGDVVANASNLVVPWNFTVVANATEAVNRMIVNNCGSVYQATEGVCLGSELSHRLAVTGTTLPSGAPSLNVVLDQPHFEWVDDVAPQVRTLEHRQGVEAQPDVRVGENYSMLLFDGANEDDLTVEFLGLDWEESDGMANAVPLIYSQPLQGYFITLGTEGLDPKLSHATTLTFRMVDNNANELLPRPTYNLTVHPAHPEVAAFHINGTTWESGPTTTGTWGVEAANFSFSVEEINDRSDLDVSIELSHVTQGLHEVPAAWNPDTLAYEATWMPSRSGLGAWGVEVLMSEATGLMGELDDGFQEGPDGIITLVDSNGPLVTAIAHPNEVEEGGQLSVNVTWTGEANETYTGAISVYSGDTLMVRKLILTTPLNTASTVVDLLGYATGTYTVTVELVDDQGNSASFAEGATSSFNILAPLVTGNAYTSQFNETQFRVFGNMAFRSGEGTVTVTLDNSTWSEVRTVSSGSFDLAFDFGGPMSNELTFDVTICDAVDTSSCDERTVTEDYGAVLNLDMTSSCQAIDVATESTDEQIVVSCTATNRGPIPVEVRLETNENEHLTRENQTLASGQTGTLRVMMLNSTELVNLSGPWSLTALNAANEETLDGGTYSAVRIAPEDDSSSSTAGTDGASSGDEGGSSVLLVVGIVALLGAAGAVLMRRSGVDAAKEAAPVSLEGHLHLDEAGEAASQATAPADIAASGPAPQEASAAAEAHEPAPVAPTGPSIDTPATSVDEHGYEWYSTHEGHWYRATGSSDPWMPYEA